MQIEFYNEIDDKLLSFAVIISKSNNKWVLCKHKYRNTYEAPGGHREPNETILDTAKRELYEETGALNFTIKQISPYSTYDGVNKTFGMLYYADIASFENNLHNEIEKILLTESLEQNWTYPEIQPKLIEKVLQHI